MLFYEIDSLRVISNGIYLETVHSAREVSQNRINNSTMDNSHRINDRAGKIRYININELIVVIRCL